MDTTGNMFDSWLKQEKAEIKEKGRKFNIIRILQTVLMIPLVLMMLIMLLDGGGIANAVALIFEIALLGISIFILADYKVRFIKPLLASVRMELPTDTERQEFARQMRTAMTFGYEPVPQGQMCEMLAAADYCYYRQPFKSRIIRNRDMKKAVLERDSYFVGRGHVRHCYVLKIFTAENEKKPVWMGYFQTEGELYAMFSRLRQVLPAETAICDNVAYGKTEKGEKEIRRKELIDIIKVFVMVAIMIVIYKLCRLL